MESAVETTFSKMSECACMNAAAAVSIFACTFYVKIVDFPANFGMLPLSIFKAQQLYWPFRHDGVIFSFIFPDTFSTDIMK